MKQRTSPDTVEEVAVKVSVDIEVVSDSVVEHSVAVLEVVEDTQDGTVGIERRQWSQADVIQGDTLVLIRRYNAFDGKLKVQHLVATQKK